LVKNYFKTYEHFFRICSNIIKNKHFYYFSKKFGVVKFKNLQKDLAAYISELLGTTGGSNALWLYLGTKLLSVANCLAQLFLINQFLGGEYYIWAYEVREKFSFKIYSIKFENIL
jgi:hypothetical protein